MILSWVQICGLRQRTKIDDYKANWKIFSTDLLQIISTKLIFPSQAVI